MVRATEQATLYSHNAELLEQVGVQFDGTIDAMHKSQEAAQCGVPCERFCFMVPARRAGVLIPRCTALRCLLRFTYIVYYLMRAVLWAAHIKNRKKHCIILLCSSLFLLLTFSTDEWPSSNFRLFWLNKFNDTKEHTLSQVRVNLRSAFYICK